MQATDLTHGRGWLDAPAAASLARMDAARGDWLRTTSTGRTRAEQAEAYRKYLNGGSYAAKEGQSPHEPGLAADFHNSAWVWLLEHGEAHGWFLTISSEPWHRVYRAAKDQHRNDPAPAGEEEDDMYDDEKHRQVLTAARPVRLYKEGTGIIAVGAGDGFWTVPTPAHVGLLIAWEIAGPNIVERPIDRNELDTMRSILRTLNPGGDGAAGADVDAVLSLSDEDVQRIVDAMPNTRAADVVDELRKRLET